MLHKPIRWVKQKFTTVMELRDDKQSIARGAAIGFFWGFTPLVGLKTILAFLSAWFFRVNKISAVVAVSLHDVFLPLYPLYAYISYHIGTALLNEQHPMRVSRLLKLLAPTTEPPEDWWVPSQFLHFLSQTLRQCWLNLYHNLHFLLPLLVGSIILAIPFSIAAYYATLFGIDHLAKRDSERIAALHGRSLGKSSQVVNHEDLKN